jgi:hypothetical protein
VGWASCEPGLRTSQPGRSHCRKGASKEAPQLGGPWDLLGLWLHAQMLHLGSVFVASFVWSNVLWSILRLSLASLGCSNAMVCLRSACCCARCMESAHRMWAAMTVQAAYIQQTLARREHGVPECPVPWLVSCTPCCDPCLCTSGAMSAVCCHTQRMCSGLWSLSKPSSW